MIFAAAKPRSRGCGAYCGALNHRRQYYEKARADIEQSERNTSRLGQIAEVIHAAEQR